MHVGYTINPRKVAAFLLIIAIYLALQSLFAEYLIENVIGDTSPHILSDILDLFSVNLEDSIPTWYSSLLLFIASVLLFLISISKYLAQDKYRHYWIGLTVIFLYLSVES